MCVTASNQTLPDCSSSRHYFFFNDTATTEIYTLSLHDALPISSSPPPAPCSPTRAATCGSRPTRGGAPASRSEEHTSELQSLRHLVCRLLLEKKKQRSATCLNRTSQIVH